VAGENIVVISGENSHQNQRARLECDFSSPSFLNGNPGAVLTKNMKITDLHYSHRMPPYAVGNYYFWIFSRKVQGKCKLTKNKINKNKVNNN
jgi:hypothetical protein